MAYTDTPMRDEFVISDPELLEAVWQVFKWCECPWSDAEAYQVAGVIEGYANKKLISSQ
jgi:hypothetical protein